MGSALDMVNMKTSTTGDIYLGIPESELRKTATLRGTPYAKLLNKMESLFTFTDIRMNYAFRTFVNQKYASAVQALASYSDVTAKITSADIEKRMQRWYGEYYLPNEVHVVEKGYDVMDYVDKYGVDYSEDFWLTDGYIIVNFDIVTMDENGKERLSYMNASNYLNNNQCSMWVMEGPPLQKTDNKDVLFNFYIGDFIIYYANKRMNDDYSGRAIY